MRAYHQRKPGVLGFALKNAWHGLVDNITVQPARPTPATAELVDERGTGQGPAGQRTPGSHR